MDFSVTFHLSLASLCAKEELAGKEGGRYEKDNLDFSCRNGCSNDIFFTQ
jgi:hypothetical protein